MLLPCVWSHAEARRRLLRGCLEVHTLQLQSSNGTPEDVPQPRRVSETSEAREAGFKDRDADRRGTALSYQVSALTPSWESVSPKGMALTAFVTGASGFLGSTLIAELNRQGVQVFALLRKTSSLANLQGLTYTRVEGDLSDARRLTAALQATGVNRFDWVFHLAGVISERDRAGYFKHNGDGSRVVGQALVDSGIACGRVVAVSSLAAAGPSKNEVPQCEGPECTPVSFYGESKRQGEVELLRFKDQLPLIFIRPPLVYGPRDKAVFLIIQTIARGVKPFLPSQGGIREKRFSAIHSDDLVAGLICAARAPLDKVPSGEAFFLAEDATYSDREMYGHIETALGRRAIGIPVPLWLVTVLAHIGGWIGRVRGKAPTLNPDKLNEVVQAYWTCSNQKAREQLGFVPRVPFPEGMRNAVTWYREQRWL